MHTYIKYLTDVMDDERILMKECNVENGSDDIKSLLLHAENARCDTMTIRSKKV